MSRIKLDLSKVKHVKSDKNMTTLQHIDGHLITLMHKALSPDNQKQLTAMAKMTQTKSQAEEAEDQQPKKMAEGGGYEEDPRNPKPPKENPTEQRLNPKHDFNRKEDEERAKQNFEHPEKIKVMYADGGPVDEKKDALNLSADFRRKQYNAEVYNNESERKNFQDAADHFEQKAIDIGTQRKKAREEGYADGGRVQQYSMLTDETPDSEAFKNGDINKEVEEADNFVHRTENPNYQPPVKQEAVDPQIQPNPYTKVYNDSYKMLKLPDMGGANPGQLEKYARQSALSAAETKQELDQANTRNLIEDQQLEHNAAVEENARRAKMGLPPIAIPAQPNIPAPEGASNVPMVEAGAQAAQPQPQGLPGAGSSHDPEGMLASGFNQRMAGINQAADVAGKLGQQQAEVLDKNIENKNIAEQTFKRNYQELENERQAHMQDIKEGYINPEKYWDNHSKIATGIGMILAGFNPTNSPNAAVNFLKMQMDQNLHAQEQNLNAKHNLLSANLRQFGNMKDATDMTRLMQNDIMTHELQSAAAKAQSASSKAAALQAAGVLQMEAAPLFQQFAMRRAMMNLAQNGATPGAVDHMLGYMRVINPEMAKEMESRYVPGIGLASTPLDQGIRKEMISKDQLNTAGRDLFKYSQTHTNLVPGTPEYNHGVTKAMAFQQMVREGLLGTVFRESEKPLLEKFVKENPAGAFKAFKTQPQLKAILESNEMGLNSIKRNYGLPVSSPNPIQEQPQIKTVNGVKYQRGPNGEAIKVK